MIFHDSELEWQSPAPAHQLAVGPADPFLFPYYASNTCRASTDNQVSQAVSMLIGPIQAAGPH